MSEKMTKPIPAIKTASREDEDAILEPYYYAFATMQHNLSLSDFEDYIDNPIYPLA